MYTDSFTKLGNGRARKSGHRKPANDWKEEKMQSLDVKAWSFASLVKVMFFSSVQQTFSEAMITWSSHVGVYTNTHIWPVITTLILKSTNKASIYQDNPNNKPNNHQEAISSTMAKPWA